jgi:hypothetical protein
MDIFHVGLSCRPRSLLKFSSMRFIFPDECAGIVGQLGYGHCVFKVPGWFNVKSFSSEGLCDAVFIHVAHVVCEDGSIFTWDGSVDA